MNIVKYVPRDSSGKFINYRKKMLKCIVYQLIILSVVMNVFQWRQTYVVRCSVGGWFMKLEKCDDLYQNSLSGQEVTRKDFVAQNPDLFDLNNLPAYAK